MQGTAQERNVATDGAAAGQATDGLGYHALEYRGRDVRFPSTLIEQWLNICLGKYTAARSDWIDDIGITCQPIQTSGIGIQQRSHLVDERSGSAGTGSVHPLLDALIEIDDLGIFSAQLDSNVCLGDKCFNRSLGGDYLLHKIQLEPLRKQQTAATGDGYRHWLFTKSGSCLLKYLGDSRADIGMVPLII